MKNKLKLCLYASLIFYTQISNAAPEENAPSSWFSCVPKPKIGVSDETLDKLQKSLQEASDKIQAGLNKTSDSIDRSIVNQNVASKTIKSLSFSLVGTFVACYGATLLVESCKNISRKLDAPENKNRPWAKVLSWKDYFAVIGSLCTIGCGFSLITQSDFLAQQA